MLYCLLYCIEIVLFKILVYCDTLQYEYYNTFSNSLYLLVLYGGIYFTYVNVLFNVSLIIVRRHRSYYLCAVALYIRLEHDTHMTCIITLSIYINIEYIIYYIKLHILLPLTNSIKILTYIANLLYLQLIYYLVLTLNEYVYLGILWLVAIFAIFFFSVSCPLNSYNNCLYSANCNGY